MANLLLNNAPQSIPGSNQGCVLNSTNSFYYGYGNTEPTHWLFGNANTEMHYDGKNGLLWAKIVSSSDTTELIYFIDGTEPLQVSGTVVQHAQDITPATLSDGYTFDVASSTVQLTIAGVSATFVRARVSTIGATVVAGYVSIKAWS